MLLRNVGFNFVGMGAPLLVAIVTIPVLISSLGADRFGLLTLIWAVVSYFGLFDLGLGRALTQKLAVVFANEESGCVGPLVATASALMATLGVMAGLLMAGVAAWGVSLIQAVPDRQEAIAAVYGMSAAMPAIVLTSAFRGILEARHAFGIINLIRIPMGLFTFLGPLAVVVYAAPRLDLIAWTLALGRVLGCAVHAYYAWRLLPSERGTLVVQFSLLRPLCVSGGWMTVSNIVSPFMGYVDRFVIGGLLSASAVAYYVTPNELVTKLWIVPGALTAVLFPTFAKQIAQRDAQTWPLFKRAVQGLFAILLPMAVALALFSHELLSAWISPVFSNNSATLLQIFALGIFFNCLAHVPFTLIQSAGSPRLTALIHTAELPFFLVALWWLTYSYGILGAAIAWLLRMVLDSGVMFILSVPFLGQSTKMWINASVARHAALALVGFSGVLVTSVTLRTLWWAGIVCAAIPLLLRLGRPPRLRHSS